ncbi:hypothetical protein WKK05_16375 [Nostoc sp. UHCC 0302]|uniref:hypothetical protein n=1 Tax=Nostoc sp. UHCC 0302 TaxID=3134896 RepID=UPI00311CDAD5
MNRVSTDGLFGLFVIFFFQSGINCSFTLVALGVVLEEILENYKTKAIASTRRYQRSDRNNKFAQ